MNDTMNATNTTSRTPRGMRIMFAALATASLLGLSGLAVSAGMGNASIDRGIVSAADRDMNAHSVDTMPDGFCFPAQPTLSQFGSHPFTASATAVGGAGGQCPEGNCTGIYEVTIANPGPGPIAVFEGGNLHRLNSGESFQEDVIYTGACNSIDNMIKSYVVRYRDIPNGGVPVDVQFYLEGGCEDCG